MKDIQQAAMKMASLSVFRGILERPIPKALFRLLWAAREGERDFMEAWGGFAAALYNEKRGGLAYCVTRAALYDENAFSLACAGGETVPEPIWEAAQRDVQTLLEISRLLPEDFLNACSFSGVQALELPRWETGEPVKQMRGEAKECMSRLKEFYRSSGCGFYARYRAFIWHGGDIRPVPYPDPVLPEELEGYELQRSMAEENVTAFLSGLPANNCLLYGDRGTGKSSTVKSLLNKYSGKGLRMVEMPKESLPDFPILAERIAAVPLKFIVFIDDLSFSAQDDSYAALKAVLEGGLAARPENTLIFATSNRRHLLRETFSDREGDEIHRGDTIQESLSLADRFGLSIRFTQPNQEEYLAVVRSLARRRGLEESLPRLEAGAERWAIARGGRSPRCAVQYVRMAQSRISRGLSLETV